MTTELKTLDVRNRQQWRTWLGKYHASSPGVWLAFYRDHTGVESISYEDSVHEALCFGWIDSLIKRLDDDRYSRKFTPRQPTSKWSDINRKRWTELKGVGLLTAAGLAAAPTANTYAPRPAIPDLPACITKALKANPKASSFFQELAPTYQRHFCGVDSFSRSTGNAGEAHSRIACSAGGRTKAGLEVKESLFQRLVFLLGYLA